MTNYDKLPTADKHNLAATINRTAAIIGVCFVASHCQPVPIESAEVQGSALYVKAKASPTRLLVVEGKFVDAFGNTVAHDDAQTGLQAGQSSTLAAIAELIRRNAPSDPISPAAFRIAEATLAEVMRPARLTKVA